MPHKQTADKQASRVICLRQTRRRADACLYQPHAPHAAERYRMGGRQLTSAAADKRTPPSTRASSTSHACLIHLKRLPLGASCT